MWHLAYECNRSFSIASSRPMKVTSGHIAVIYSIVPCFRIAGKPIEMSIGLSTVLCQAEAPTKIMVELHARQ